VIATERLRLVPVSASLAQVAMHDPADLESILGVRVPGGWPGPDYRSALPIIAKAIDIDPSLGEWSRWILEPGERVLVGDIGFKSLPQRDGSAEMGYSIVAPYRRRGYASEATRAMIAWAFRHDAVRRVTASCLNDNAASIRVLQNGGLRQIGRSGPLLDWVIERAAWEPSLPSQ
jgi:ribosomal-protein-alanine N-acetyltransferase